MVLAVETEDCRNEGNKQEARLAESESRVQCSCQAKPEDKTILHGILTGQGHKYGYTGANSQRTSARLYHLRSCRLQQENQRYHHPSCSLGGKRAPSPEVISRLRSTYRERNK